MRQWIEYAVENYRGKNSFGFQLAKDLKERQIIQAVERYARGVKPEEVVALMDTSVFRSGKTGFLLTERYLYSDKYREEGPVSLMFLKSVSVRPENNSCCVLTFKDDSTRDVDISVFLDVVDVLKLIIEQRDGHESDEEEFEDSAKGGHAGEDRDGQRDQEKEHTGTVAEMRALGYQKGTAEDRTVFEDSAEDFLRTVRSDEAARDEGVPDVSGRSSQGASVGDERFSQGAPAGVERYAGVVDGRKHIEGRDAHTVSDSFVKEALEASKMAVPGISVEEGGIRTSENHGEGITATEGWASSLEGAGKTSGEDIHSAKEVKEPEDSREAGKYEVSGLSIEIIPVDEFEEPGESEESREQRWLAEFSQSGEPGDLILEDEPDLVQGQEEPAIPGQEENSGKEENEETLETGAQTGESDQIEESFEELLKKAEAGDSAAMYQAAELYYTGEQTARDAKQAGDARQAQNEKHEDEARQKQSIKRAEDARQVQNEEQIKNAKPAQDIKQAMRWFRESARLEYVPAMLKMVYFYREGEQVKKNFTLSLSWVKKAAATGDPKGQYALVDSYLYGLDGKQDTRAGLALLSKMAEQGDESAKETADDVLNKIKEAKERFDAGIKNPSTASGYYEMGMYCLNGDGFYNYPKEAVRYLRKAAEKEHVHAEYQLALAYHTGEGVKKDEDECIRWLEKAAAKSHKEAGELLADLQEKRRIKQEKTEFKNHLRQAEKGDAYAQSKTAELYLQGIGVKQDIQKGIEWYEKASETDEGYAARQLAKLYSDGEFVPVDPEKAAYWRMVGGVLDEL